MTKTYHKTGLKLHTPKIIKIKINPRSEVVISKKKRQFSKMPKKVRENDLFIFIYLYQI